MGPTPHAPSRIAAVPGMPAVIALVRQPRTLPLMRVPPSPPRRNASKGGCRGGEEGEGDGYSHVTVGDAIATTSPLP
jgi:hypothetical protein